MHEGRTRNEETSPAPDAARRFEEALRVVRRALDENGGTALALAPAAAQSFELVHPSSASRATVCVVGSDVYFLRRELPGVSSSSTFRSGWYRVRLPTLHVLQR